MIRIDSGARYLWHACHISRTGGGLWQAEPFAGLGIAKTPPNRTAEGAKNAHARAVEAALEARPDSLHLRAYAMRIRLGHRPS